MKPGKRLPVGTRVRVTGDLSKWTATAQANLPGTLGVVEDYKPNYDFEYPAHLVRFDSPVQVNPITSFACAWIACENLTEVKTP